MVKVMVKYLGVVSFLLIMVLVTGCVSDWKDCNYSTRNVNDLYQGYGTFLSPQVEERNECVVVYEYREKWVGDVHLCQRHFYLNGYMRVLTEDDGFYGKISGGGALTFWSISGELQDVNRYYYVICDVDDPDICIPAWTKRDQTQPGPYFAREDKPVRVWGLATESGFRICQFYGW